MAKRKKLQDNNPPRRVEIRGQDHLLAYITPKEAQLLMDNGGSGEPGPMGIPAFFDVGEGMGGYDSKTEGAADTAGGRGDPDAGVAPGDSYSDDSAAYDYSGFYTETPNVETGFSDYAITNPNQDARDIAAAQLAIAKAYKVPERKPGIMGIFGYNTPKVALDLLQAKAGQFMMPRISNALKDNLMNPVYGYNNRVTGVSDQYGNLIEGTDPLGTLQSTREAGGFGDSGSEPETKPVNPVTGQCDAGYVYNENMGACIKETPSDYSSSAIYNQYEPGVYATMGLLDQTPQGLLEVAGQPYDFDTANTQFRMQSGTRPQYFTGPYSQEGRTRIG